MAKWHGKVGFAMTTETPEGSGIWKEVIIAKTYTGDLTQNIRRTDDNEKINTDIILNNQISIIADPYAITNFHAIRYVEFMGTKWRVNTVVVKYPRLVLSVGGVYNEH